jgi:hypothetical protein
MKKAPFRLYERIYSLQTGVQSEGLLMRKFLRL